MIGSQQPVRRGTYVAPSRRPDYTARAWTAEEIATRTADCLELPPAAWHLLQPQDHVCYVNEEGRWLPGGYVVRVDNAAPDGAAPVRTLHLSNCRYTTSKDRTEWQTHFYQIQRLWVRLNAVEFSLLENIRALGVNQQKLADFCRRLEARLDAVAPRDGVPVHRTHSSRSDRSDAGSSVHRTSSRK